jgi:hypothetical protein
MCSSRTPSTKRFIASLLNTSLGLEVITQLAEDELGGLVDLVTDVSYTTGGRFHLVSR